ncbi:PREDICTED: uncharacterized protein LOC109468238 isoform X1 [Branchiostoma belcheri]|uniref:Uncharacterized protein LOC109468238 isoform X1 n=1 Tax=Branchiostoma belcheri TaxID=7741 RepID=A0A6P4YCB4_BRABE|nr:PREDICTED: uncharacterized protein LOC109468238 isoform X1 [Branchiostoma belcheri]
MGPGVRTPTLSKLFVKTKVVYVDKYTDVTEKRVREAEERKAKELREQAERERREIQEAERRDEERRRHQQHQEEQERLRNAERLRRLQQEALGERTKLLLYRFGDKHGLRNFATIDIRDMQQSARGLRIGMFGPSGSGKSSFINTCERAVKQTIRGTCETQTSGQEGTILVQEYLDNIGSKFCLVDTRGFFNYGNEEFTAMKNIVYGRIKAGEKIEVTGEEQVDESNSQDTFTDWLHAIVIVLSAKDPLLLDGTHTTNLNTIRHFMKPRGIAPVTVITHVDRVRGNHELERIKLKASAATGSPPNHVYFIQNYHPEHEERDFNTELQAMKILNAALVVGERFVKISKQQHQYDEETKQAAAARSRTRESIDDFFDMLCQTKKIPHDRFSPTISALKREDVTTTKLLRDHWTALENILPIGPRMKTYIKDALFEKS